MSANDTDLMRKVQALLAKAEGTDNENEAESFFAKARALGAGQLGVPGGAYLPSDLRRAYDVRSLLPGLTGTAQVKTKEDGDDPQADAR